MEPEELEKLRQARQVGLDNPVCNFYRKIAEKIVSHIHTFPIHPNVITVLSFLLVALAARFATSGTYLGFLLCATISLLGCVFDFVDGSLARHKKMENQLGSYLDNLFDNMGQILLTVGFTIGFAHLGKTNFILLTPLIVYASDTLIAFAMTHYRLEFIDPVAQKEDLQKKFESSLALKLGRNLLPPVFARTLLFPIFAFFNLTLFFFSLFAIYQIILALAFCLKVGYDVRSIEQAKRNSKKNN
jgi:phosphatidylglycerophosphate synthase